MEKITARITKGLTGTFRIAYFLLAAGAILVLAYVLGGYKFLTFGTWGSDMPLAFSFAAWVDKYFPRVPFWFPLAGSGVSITHSYPMLSFYLVALLKRLTDLDLVQAFSLLAFASVPLMALGIYGYVSLRFKNQTAALIASIFYLLSPIAWVWLYDWGFYAEAVSFVFVMPAVIFWEFFFAAFLEGKVKGFFLALTVIFLSLAMLTHFGTGLALIGFFAFYFLGHLIKGKERRRVFIRGALGLFLVALLAFGLTAFSTLPFFRYSRLAGQAGVGVGKSYEEIKSGAYTIGHVLGFRPPAEDNFLFAHRNISFPVFVSCLALLGFLLAFLPACIATRGIAGRPAKIRGEGANQGADLLTLALYALFALALRLDPNLLYWGTFVMPQTVSTMYSNRFVLIFLRFILPVLAGLGAVNVFKLLLFWLKENRLTKPFKGVFASLAGLSLAFAAFVFLGNFTGPGKFEYQLGIRMIEIDRRNIWRQPRKVCLPEKCLDYGTTDLCLNGEWRSLVAKLYPDMDDWCRSPLAGYFDALAVRDWCRNAEEKLDPKVLPEICDKNNLTAEKAKLYWKNCGASEDPRYGFCKLKYLSLGEQLAPSGRPALTIDREVIEEAAGLSELKRSLKEIGSRNPATFANVAGSARFDFAQEYGNFAMIAPYFTADTGLSQIRIYNTSSLLNQRFQAQKVGGFYLNELSGEERVKQINEISRWFGINYIFFDRKTDLESFGKAGWKEILPFLDVYNVKSGGVLEFTEENTLAELLDRPAVLVIGQKKGQAYDQVFRVASLGALPYEDALLVWGEERIDRYSPEDLRNFDVLVLHGYDYANRTQADKLLTDYVKEGGRVFIDTGWQYATPDWETKKDQETLEIIPFTRLSWTIPKEAGGFVLEDARFGKGVDASQFGPLVYGDQPWGISTGSRSGLKDWAKVLLSAGKDSPPKADCPLIATGEFGKGRVVWSGMNVFPHAKQEGTVYREEIKLLANLFDWLGEGKSGRRFDVSYTRKNPDAVEFVINEDVPEREFLLWKEAYHPDFHAYLIGSQKPLELKAFRAGPVLTAIRIPQVNKGARIVYEYRQPWSEKAAAFLSLATCFLLLFAIFEGPILKEKSLFARLVRFSETALHRLFFGLWKKPSWLGKEEDEEY